MLLQLELSLSLLAKRRIGNILTVIMDKYNMILIVVVCCLYWPFLEQLCDNPYHVIADKWNCSMVKEVIADYCKDLLAEELSFRDLKMEEGLQDIFTSAVVSSLY